MSSAYRPRRYPAMRGPSGRPGPSASSRRRGTSTPSAWSLRPARVASA